MVWREDITETDIVIEAGFNEETESRSQTPAIYVNRLQTVPARVILGDRVGLSLPDHCEGFGAIATVAIMLDCVSNDDGESAVIGDLIQFMILASQDVIQREFGFYDMTHPSLGQTQPYERDQSKWNTAVTFQVQFWIRWSQVPISPLLQQIAMRVTAGGLDVNGHFVDITRNSFKRGELLDIGDDTPPIQLPPSRVSIVGPAGPAGPPGSPGAAGIDGVLDLSGHDALDTLTHKLAEDYHAEFVYAGKTLTRVTTWASIAMLLKIREVSLSYTGKSLTGVVTVQYDGLGAVVCTLTKTLAYSGKTLVSVAAVKTFA
jgi:hypothetical protein